jgi:beta-aspartyl-dipeptidase (metallo-type)
VSTEILWLRDAEVFAPEPLGRADLLLAAGRILHVGEVAGLGGLPGLARRSLGGRLVVPGFVDQHVHVAGAGGEGGFAYRTPPLPVGELVRAGVGTAVGLLGTDGLTRSALELLAEVRRLKAAGFAAHMYVGAYWVPTRTITGSLREDLLVVPEVIGAGEIAVADHRGSQPDPAELDRLAREVYVGGLLAGKAAVLHLHLGDEDDGLDPVLEAWRRSALPIRLFRPTHLNRNRRLLASAPAFARHGGFVDVTAGIFPAPGDPEPVAPADALDQLRQAGVPLERLTVSSDAGGSSPVFDAEGRLARTSVLRPAVLFEAFRNLAGRWPLAEALRPFTRTPADGLGLEESGRLAAGARADLLVLDADLSLVEVYVSGRRAFAEGRLLLTGPYEAAEAADDPRRLTLPADPRPS